MTTTEIERIEKEARSFTEGWGENCDIRSYIAGATAEHDKARNQAIQDCINDIKNRCTDWEIITKPLEQLKTIS